MTGTTGQTSALLARLRAGDQNARDELVEHTHDNLRHRAHQMLRGFPRVRRWEQTEDVLQNAWIRMCRALAAAVPKSAQHFYKLASKQIRRELLDLVDRYQGPLGLGANHHTDPTGGAVTRALGGVEEPSNLAEWGEFHRIVEGLPEEWREVFGLLWYHQLTQAEAAEVLGVSERTLKRRWQEARIALAQALGGPPA
jgi:RNA polymerase sigma-70 factor (ECF subfamily)